ncbi:hypothetical protein ACJ2CR_17075 [Myxococcus faecalis]|uniref:hypothetical protein n=1 Tax=Myxococcus faecalis TaxID=3115646 RepID=UPI0024CA2DC4|nr:YgdI/YgdR family lipoprotein [Myxococcus sp. MH1]
MKKLLLGMFLATLSLVGCGTEEANLPETGQVMTMEDGRELVIEQRSAEPGEEAPDVDAANVSVDEDSLACWVVLNYCRHPDTGRPHCTATGCTIAQAIKHCQALIRKTC